MVGVAEKLVLVFIPSLASVLLRAEQEKGSPLTEQDTLAIRDKAVCVAFPEDKVPASEEARGYPDIDPEDCWAEWQRLRVELRVPELE